MREHSVARRSVLAVKGSKPDSTSEVRHARITDTCKENEGKKHVSAQALFICISDIMSMIMVRFPFKLRCSEWCYQRADRQRDVQHEWHCHFQSCAAIEGSGGSSWGCRPGRQSGNLSYWKREMLRPHFCFAEAVSTSSALSTEVSYFSKSLLYRLSSTKSLHEPTWFPLLVVGGSAGTSPLSSLMSLL